MTWDESRHRRDELGQFTEMGVSGWVRKVADRMGRADRVVTMRQAADRGELPPGHGAASLRAQHLRGVPGSVSRGGQGRDRTDAEQAELDQLEQAFDAYRQQLGLRTSRFSGSTTYADESGQLYNEYGERIKGFDVQTTDVAPTAHRRGFTRVGDHPEGFGRVGGENRGVVVASTHPTAGGLWIDPADPGTRHAPRYLDDLGHRVSQLQPDLSRSLRRKTDQRINKIGTYGNPAALDRREVRSTQPRVRVTYDRLGYGMAEAEGGAVFVAHMKRVQPRVRQETAREAVRRTPRGTTVDSWMQHVSDRIDQTRGRRV